MTSSATNFRLVLPRRLRAALALFVLTAYMVGGVLHGLRDMDVTTAGGGAAISFTNMGPTGHSDQGALADHHCHGCFSVFVPVPVIGSADVMLAVKVMAVGESVRRGMPPGIDPPPPKFLT